MTTTRRRWGALVLAPVLAPVLALVPDLVAARGQGAGAVTLLANPSFERGLEGWELAIMATNDPQGGVEGGTGGTSVAVVDGEVSHHGSRSLRLTGDGDSVAWQAAMHPAIAVTPGTRLVVGGWLRTENVRREGRQYTNCNVLVQFFDATGAVVRSAAGYPAVGTRPLLGSHEWTRVETVERVPAAARAATFGCFLSCSGTAWFDAVELRVVVEPRWNELASDRYLLRWEGDDAPSPAVIAGNERHLVQLEALLGVTLDEPIVYTRYRDNARKGELTGQPGNAHVEGSNEIHSIFWGDRHEVVHLLTRRWGQGTGLLGEGLAVYLSGSWQGLPVDDWARRLADRGELPALAELVATTGFRRASDLVTYPVAGSFVKYLVEQHGVAAFRELFESVPLDPDGATFDAALARSHDTNLDALEQGWHVALGQEIGASDG